jgi:hypothetical protein
MFGGIEHFDKKIFCRIEENLTIGEGALEQIISIKSDDVALFFKSHLPEIFDGEHGFGF